MNKKRTRSRRSSLVRGIATPHQLPGTVLLYFADGRTIRANLFETAAGQLQLFGSEFKEPLVPSDITHLLWGSIPLPMEVF